MCKLVVISLAYTITLATELIIVLTVIEVVGCESESSNIFVWNSSSCMSRVSRICLLLLLLVFQVALNERSYGCLVVTWGNSLRIFIVDVLVSNAKCGRRLRLGLTVTASLAVLVTSSMTTTYLV